MSEENVALTRELLEGFASRDHERAFELYDPDIEWDTSDLRDVIPDIAGVCHGHDGVRTYWSQWLSAWRDLDFDIEDILDAGDDAAALICNQRQWGRHSGIVTEMPPYAIVFSFREGKVIRWKAYADQSKALQAAGLQD